MGGVRVRQILPPHQTVWPTPRRLRRHGLLHDHRRWVTRGAVERWVWPEEMSHSLHRWRRSLELLEGKVLPGSPPSTTPDFKGLKLSPQGCAWGWPLAASGLDPAPRSSGMGSQPLARHGFAARGLHHLAQASLRCSPRQRRNASMSAAP